MKTNIKINDLPFFQVITYLIFPSYPHLILTPCSSSALLLLYSLSCLYPPLTLRMCPAPGPVCVLPVPATACGAPPGAGGTPHTRGAGWCWQRAYAPSGSAERLRRIRWWTRLGSCPHTPPAASWFGSVEPLGGPGSMGGGGQDKE